MMMLQNQRTILCLATILFIVQEVSSLAQLSNAPTNATGDAQARPTGTGQPSGSDASSRSNSRSTRSSSRDSYVRLARAPNMFGDSLRPTGTLEFFQTVNDPLQVDTFMSGASNYNIAENNGALPTDRVYFVYNGFYNAINFPGAGNTSLQRYTLGFERTFFDGLWSVDLRMPFTSGFDLTTPFISTDSGNVGNLSIFLKGLMLREEDWAISAGLGIGLPTGSDIVTNTFGNQVTIQNESVHLMPFLALSAAPNDDWFLQAFTQLDFAASGNDVIAIQNRVGTFTEQNLFHADIALGRWLARDLGRPFLYGVASLLELHYATTIQDTDVINIAGNGLLSTLVNRFNRVDLLNLTAGLHFQLTPLSNFRVGAVTPLRANPDRTFDSELQVSFNRLF
ncbi:MAG: hypothetical protein ABL921_02225 [Pirellula sp.]